MRVVEEIIMKPVGFILSPYEELDQIPAQGSMTREVVMSAKIFPEYLDAMRDLKVGDLITIIFRFHKTAVTKNIVFSYRKKVERGVFSTRSPLRPNGIGITNVQITKIDGDRIYFVGGDMLNGTPVLDIKPSI